MEQNKALEEAANASPVNTQMQKHIINVLKDTSAQIEHLASDNRYMAARLGVFDSMVEIFRAGNGGRGMSCSDGSSSPAWRAKQLIAELENPKASEEVIMNQISMLQGELDVIHKRMAVLLEEIKK